MVEGRLNKLLKQVTLEGQPYLRDPGTTAGDLLKSEKARVSKFVRFEVGEGIEKEAQDFASEVMAQVNNTRTVNLGLVNE